MLALPSSYTLYFGKYEKVRKKRFQSFNGHIFLIRSISLSGSN